MYKLSVIGCDDTTEVKLDLTTAEKEFLYTLCDLVNETSTGCCMPTMELVEDNADDSGNDEIS